jgi:serine/threonine-protein kinase
MVGRTLDDRFMILAKLGAGSMGTVYRARQHAIGRDVAIKILRSDRATDATAKARFLREARANSLLASPHTVTVFDFGQSDSGEFYLAMELLEGESLGQRLQHMKRLPVDIAVETTRQALRSLAEAHAKGIIHRDLKPDNLFYARVKQGQHHAQVEEIVKILDFGIAKMIQGEDASPLNAVETQAGTVFGTPRYMSPEQAQGKPLDARSDLYSLAVILYQMLTGRPCFTDNDAIVVMARHIKTAPKPPTEACPEANIPAELEAVMMRALSKDAKQRPPNAEAFSAELARALDLGAAVTSGVRSVRPPPVNLPTSVPPPPIVPPSPPSAASLTLDEAGLVPSRRHTATMVIVLALLVSAVLAIAIFVVRRRSTAEQAPPVVATASATAEPDIPPPPPSSATARTDPSNDGPPVVTPDSLPKVTAGKRGGGRRQPSASNKAGPPAAAPAAPPAPATAPAPAPPAPSSHYGIFE